MKINPPKEAQTVPIAQSRTQIGTGAGNGMPTFRTRKIPYAPFLQNCCEGRAHFGVSWRTILVKIWT
jgi:hypothetical protein